jgi:hypothetical protein
VTAAPRLIREDDFVVSIADALQYIAVYHPPSFIRAARGELHPGGKPGLS